MKKRSFENLLRRDIIRRLVVDTAIPESVIKDVISHMSDGVTEAFKTCRTVEISGFGKFVFSDRRGQIFLTKYEGYIRENNKNLAREDISEEKRKAYMYRGAAYASCAEDIRAKMKKDDKLETCN